MTRILLTVVGLSIALAAPARAELAYVVDVNNNLFRFDIDGSGGPFGALLIGR